MQSIIVYRRPVEAAFWEMMFNGLILPLIIGAVFFFAFVMIVEIQIIHRFLRFKKYRIAVSWISVGLAAMLTFLMVRQLLDFMT